MNSRPITLLFGLFVIWKGLLLAIAYLNPGVRGYDSSSDLLLNPEALDQSRIALAFSRWDAIYFASAAKWGYVYEQEWAFAWGPILRNSGIFSP